ncbi:2-dehydropantoate 2-reductase N-terminal domain-containing protein [Pseudonocardia asaccharolytica]|uniref:Ketopantoate reductase N-terminal domain-containing protein n=1 Tax=Pseudonocardia asaccharolytica DSM 44247 = NBRC 16224 TaxID=1123024 RepID=A0A511D2C7_9PSEU|nr:2-dehydropantoate 2-reductase N-terminal domain-containing protein [Pseudonocardia asaccharolytica]GEL18936.1 hypothetical protein PA7_27730 [Pseudonocardia asaccharolytica DSM 44247 = NBRC 16224]
MSLHVIVGAGAIGGTTARLLHDEGHDVRVITRSGSGPEGVEKATAERAWGRAWHVPTDRPAPLRAVAAHAARLAGVPAREILVMPHWALRAMGLAVPFIRELEEVRHQFTRPFLLDSSAAQQTFGLAPTPFDEGLAAHVEFWQRRQRAAA